MAIKARMTLLLVTAGCGPIAPSKPATLSAADRTAIHALDSGFVKGWLDDDTAAVLRSFHPHAVLFPPGSAPVEGLTAIRNYWWPTDGSHTRITSFTRTVAEIEGTPGLAYLRGSASLGWVYRMEDKETAQTSRSIDLVVLAPDSSGHWRIVRQMWSQLPP